MSWRVSLLPWLEVKDEVFARYFFNFGKRFELDQLRVDVCFNFELKTRLSFVCSLTYELVVDFESCPPILLNWPGNSIQRLRSCCEPLNHACMIRIKRLRSFEGPHIFFFWALTCLGLFFCLSHIWISHTPPFYLFFKFNFLIFLLFILFYFNFHFIFYYIFNSLTL